MLKCLSVKGLKLKSVPLKTVLAVLSLLFLVGLSFAADTYLGSGGSYGTPGQAAVSGIDGKTQANTTVFTNSSGQDFYVTEVHLILTAVSGLGTPPVISVGITSANYTDFVNAFALTSLTAANNVIEPTLVAVRARVPSGTALVCRVATAAINTTSYTFSVVVKGFYL